MSTSNTLRTFVLASLTVLALSACGQRGPLKVPTDDESTESEEQTQSTTTTIEN